MTNIEYINWIERMITGCDDLKGMEREKAIYQNCLKKARMIGQKLPIQRVSNSVFCECELPTSSFELDNGKICCCACERQVSEIP